MTPDPRAEREGICGVIDIGGTGIEWICVKQVHAQVYERRTSGQRYRKGDPIYSTNPSADAHYFVPRWPSRLKEDDDLPTQAFTREGSGTGGRVGGRVDSPGTDDHISGLSEDGLSDLIRAWKEEIESEEEITA